MFENYRLKVDMEGLKIDLRRAPDLLESRFAEGVGLLPQIEQGVCRVLRSLGYNLGPSGKVGVIETNGPLDQQTIDKVRIVGIVYGVPITVEYMGRIPR